MGFFGLPNIEKLKAEKDVKKLIEALSHKDSDIRRRAAEALGAIKDAEALVPLIAALKDRNKYVREKAAEALRKFDFDKLYYATKTSIYLITKKWAKIIEIGEPAVETLIDALKDRDGSVRYYAAKALGEIKDKRAVAPLTFVLNDKNINTQYAAAIALHKMGDKRGIEFIIYGLENPKVKKRSAKLLERIGLEDLDAKTKALVYIAKGEWKEAVKLHFAAVEPLINTLKDDNWHIRASAAEALGEIKDERAAESLIDILKDKNWRVSARAAEALGKIKDRRAVEPLIDALKDKEPHLSDTSGVESR